METTRERYKQGWRIRLRPDYVWPYFSCGKIFRHPKNRKSLTVGRRNYQMYVSNKTLVIVWKHNKRYKNWMQIHVC